jgi:hypothetical protein
MAEASPLRHRMIEDMTVRVNKTGLAQTPSGWNHLDGDNLR